MAAEHPFDDPGILWVDAGILSEVKTEMMIRRYGTSEPAPFEREEGWLEEVKEALKADGTPDRRHRNPATHKRRRPRWSRKTLL